MGSNNAGEEQKGEHAVTVPSFYLDKYEVTNAEYAEFIKATGKPAPEIDPAHTIIGTYWEPWNGTDPPSGRDRWPVANVSPKDVEDFAAWLSKRDGVVYRLPTEEEWEFAARNGSRNSLFPWGNSWEEGRANINEKKSPVTVGSFPRGATQSGVHDMIGNVWEWTSSKPRFYDNTDVSCPLSKMLVCKEVVHSLRRLRVIFTTLQTVPGSVTKTPSFPRSASGLLVIESSSRLQCMQHAKRKFKPRFTNYRWMAHLLPVLLVLSFAEIRNQAEETVVVDTDRHPIEAHPIYLIAAPPQEKMAPRPLNVPIVSARQTPAKNDSSNDLQLPFPMSAAQAVRIGNGLIEDSDASNSSAVFGIRQETGS